MEFFKIKCRGGSPTHLPGTHSRLLVQAATGPLGRGFQPPARFPDALPLKRSKSAVIPQDCCHHTVFQSRKLRSGRPRGRPTVPRTAQRQEGVEESAALGPPGACLPHERESRCLRDVTGHVFRGSRPLGADPKGSPVPRGSSPPLLPADRAQPGFLGASRQSSATLVLCLFVWLHWA